jgi:predicted lipoprotein
LTVRKALLIVALLAGPAVQAAEEAAIPPVIEQTLAGYIAPAYRTLADATGRLHAAIGRYCADPSADGRAQIAADFAATLQAWAGVDFIRFGPMAEEGRLERFAYWPDVHNTGARQLRRFLASEDIALLDQGALAEQSAAVQGLPALESLLYSGDSALLVAASPEKYRCALAGAVADNLDAIAAAAAEGWAPGAVWPRLLTAPAPDNPLYRTHQDAMTEILKAVLTGLEQLRDHRLLPAVGTTPEDAKASRAPYYRSDASLAYLLASAEALERYVDISGLLSLLPADQHWIANSARFEFDNLQQALVDAGPDLEAALAEPQRRQKLVYAGIVLASLRDLFQGAVSAGLGITAGFNALDGD